MSDEDTEVTLYCSKCKSTASYKLIHFETFNRIRCVKCNETISIVALNIAGHLQQLREIITKPKSDDWTNKVYDSWAYILRNREYLKYVDQKLRFDTCVELYSVGVTFIPGKTKDGYRDWAIIEILLSDGFNATSFLPTNIHVVPSDNWANSMAVHFNTLGKLLEGGEYVLHFEFGQVLIGVGRHWRFGTIALTNRRLFFIGLESVSKIGDKFQITHHIKYPAIRDFSVEVYKHPGTSGWRSLISPEPDSAAIFCSLDYFELNKLRHLEVQENEIVCIFRDQSYVEILPLKNLNPFRGLRDTAKGWPLFKVPARRAHKSGNYRLSIHLDAQPGSTKDSSEYHERVHALANAIPAVVNGSFDHGLELT